MSDSRIDRYFAGGDLVVDLGCGNGAWLETVRQRYARAVGLDISVDAATSRGGRVEGWEFIQRDLNEGPLPLSNGCADGVLANQVIEHVANPLRLVKEAHRILRPGGVLVVTTPNVRYLPHLIRLVVMGHGPLTSGGALRTPEVWDDGHVHFFTSRDLEWLGRAAGFSRVQSAALIAATGRAGGLRRALDLIGSRAIVKDFLSGNVMLVASK